MATIQLCPKRQAILNQAGHLLVTGGPGSGKTTIAMLKAQKRAKTFQPGQEILFLSFSRGAVRQILQKSTELLKSAERELVQVQTYHSFCIEVLLSHGRLLRGRACRFIYPADERLLKSACTGDWEQERAKQVSEKSLYCFDLVAAGAAELLEKSAAVRALYGSKFPMIVVDEFQDTDNDQWRIVRALGKVADVFCLADPEQRIFEYRPTVSPHRLDDLRAELAPAEFDLGTENHRSPAAGILAYADCVLRNQGPLPVTKDVSSIVYYGADFEARVHLATISTFGELRKKGIATPTVAVMCRSNAFVSNLSTVLRQEHTFNGARLPPIEHSVVWDAELSAAAAAVLGGILEWSQGAALALPKTLRLIGHYYRLRNAEHPSKTASDKAQKCDEAADLLASGGKPKLKMVKELAAMFEAGLTMLGDPVKDWRAARDHLQRIDAFAEVYRDASMVRLFGARDALATGLAGEWLDKGHYGNASDIVKGILDREHFLSLDRAPRGCTLMTIHKSKGKEFDGVVLVESAFKSQFFDTREQPPYERSRRLLRVGLTRARTFVTLVRPSKAQPLVD